MAQQSHELDMGEASREEGFRRLGLNFAPRIALSPMFLVCLVDSRNQPIKAWSIGYRIGARKTGSQTLQIGPREKPERYYFVITDHESLRSATRFGWRGASCFAGLMYRGVGCSTLSASPGRHSTNGLAVGRRAASMALRLSREGMWTAVNFPPGLQPSGFPAPPNCAALAARPCMI